MKKSLHAVGFSSVFFHLGSFSKGDIFLLFYTSSGFRFCWDFVMVG